MGLKEKVKRKSEEALSLLGQIDKNSSPQEKSNLLRKARMAWSEASITYYDLEAKISK